MNVKEVQRRLSNAKESLESRMLRKLHVRFGVGGGVKLPALHHVCLMYRVAA